MGHRPWARIQRVGVDGERASEPQPTMGARDIQPDFVDARVLVPDAGNACDRPIGGVRGERNADRSDLRVLPGLGQSVLELPAGAEALLLGEREFGNAVAGGQIPGRQVYCQHHAFGGAVGTRALVTQCPCMRGQSFEE